MGGMSISLHQIALLFFSLLLLHHFVQANIDQELYDTDRGQSPYIPTMDCGEACNARCEKASRHKMCLRACGTCCDRCNCVPPGTSGNQEICPCYYNMTTHGGRRKCP